MRNPRLMALGLISALFAVLLLAGGGRTGPPAAVAVLQTETPTPTPETPTPTPGTPTPTPTATATGTPTPTATPTVTNITLTPAGGFLGCAQSTTITVVATTAAGNVPDGTPFQASVNIGTISPTSGTTTGGGVILTYTAPSASGGLVVVQVTVAGRTQELVMLVGCPVAAAQIGFPTTQCVGLPPVSANATFHWIPAQGAIWVWVDVSLTDHFALGSFIGIGPLSGAASEATLNGLQPNRVHYWRVNALTPQGWVTSEVKAFVPCGRPQPLTPTYTCTGGGRATIHFSWAPASPPGFNQWVDLSVFNNNFAAGTFLGAGPFQPWAYSLSWPGVLANVVHYWRVNTSSVLGWNTSETRSFIALCP